MSRKKIELSGRTFFTIEAAGIIFPLFPSQIHKTPLFHELDRICRKNPCAFNDFKNAIEQNAIPLPPSGIEGLEVSNLAFVLMHLVEFAADPNTLKNKVSACFVLQSLECDVDFSIKVLSGLRKAVPRQQDAFWRAVRVIEEALDWKWRKGPIEILRRLMAGEITSQRATKEERDLRIEQQAKVEDTDLAKKARTTVATIRKARRFLLARDDLR